MDIKRALDNGTSQWTHLGLQRGKLVIHSGELHLLVGSLRVLHRGVVELACSRPPQLERRNGQLVCGSHLARRAPA